MLYFDRVAVSERIDVHNASASKEYDICHKQTSAIDVMIY